MHETFAVELCGGCLDYRATVMARRIFVQHAILCKRSLMGLGSRKWEIGKQLLKKKAKGALIGRFLWEEKCCIIAGAAHT